MTERSSEALAAALEYVALEWPNTANAEVCVGAAAAIRRLRSQSLIHMDRAVEAEDELRRLSARCAALEQSSSLRARVLVMAQAEDDGLWFKAQTAPEAYLQQALRRLHAAIEGSALSTPSEEPQR